MNFNSLRYEILIALIRAYPNEGKLHFLLALEEAASGNMNDAKESLGSASKLCDPSMKADIIDLMCYLYSGKSLIPIKPSDRATDVFFEMDKFSLKSEYTEDELDEIEKLADEILLGDEDFDISLDEDALEIYPPNLRLVQDNDFTD